MSAPTTELPGSSIDPDLEVGVVVGEYTVEGKLGQGAFGTVFKAAHPLIGKIVAIKVLSRRFSVDPEMVSRFVAEARAVNQIRNRHIIDIFSFGQLPDGRHYYVMEYLDGETLDALIERDSKVPVAEALPILRGVAKALDAAHGKGIAHRDLKAENVFLGKDGDGVVVKLLDFGIAKLMTPDDGLKHKTRTGVAIGTPFYMSPEQARGQEVDHRTDIYAFGVLTYLTLTGKYPFDGDEFLMILMAHCSEQPAPPSTHAPELPAAVDDVVLWLMSKDPADRPTDLKTAVRALEQAADEAGIATKPPTSVWDAHTGPSLKALKTRPPNLANARTVASAGDKSRTRQYAALGGIALLGIGAAVMLAMRSHDDTRAHSAAIPTTTLPALAQQPAPQAALQPAPQLAPQPAPPPAAPRDVIVTVAGVPDGTEVIASGKTIGVAPGPVQLPSSTDPIVLTFRADGFVAASRSIVADHDQALSITLKNKPHGNGPKTTKDDIIDVFGGKK